jgi:hypothetical protein
MTSSNARCPALARAAEGMLRALGGCEVRLRCPVAAAKDEQARQLGFDAPITEDVSIAPVVVLANADSFELLIAPGSVAQYLQDRAQTAQQFFASVLAVLYGGRELRVKLFHVEQFAGAEYLYRVTVASS